MDQSSPTTEEGRGQELLEVPLDDPSSHTKRATTPTSLEKMENFVDSIGDWGLSRKLTKKDIKRVVLGEVQDHEEVFDSKGVLTNPYYLVFFPLHLRKVELMESKF